MRWSCLPLVLAACWTGSEPEVFTPTRPPKRRVVTTELPAPPEPPIGDSDLGRSLFGTKGCIACHTTDGSPRIGPSWRGIWSSDVLLSDRRIVRVDSGYIRRSLADPQADLVFGFPPVMPSFAGILTNEEIEALIAFIATL